MSGSPASEGLAVRVCLIVSIELIGGMAVGCPVSGDSQVGYRKSPISTRLLMDCL
jgi:hypothetical protein